MLYNNWHLHPQVNHITYSNLLSFLNDLSWWAALKWMCLSMTYYDPEAKMPNTPLQSLLPPSIQRGRPSLLKSANWCPSPSGQPISLFPPTSLPPPCTMPVTTPGRCPSVESAGMKTWQGSPCPGSTCRITGSGRAGTACGSVATRLVELETCLKQIGSAGSAQQDTRS